MARDQRSKKNRPTSPAQQSPFPAPRLTPTPEQAMALEMQRRMGNRATVAMLRATGRLGSVAETRGTEVRLHPLVADHPERARIEAHEAVHVAQNRAREAGVQPTADRSALEAEAERGAEAAMRGHSFTPTLAAPAAMTLGYPEGPVELSAVDREVLAATDDIPNQDIIYEQLALLVAYRYHDAEQLRGWGYGPPTEFCKDQLRGVEIWRVDPLDLPPAEAAQVRRMHGRALVPVLAFRGSSEALHWLDNTSPEGVGAYLLGANEGTIAHQMEMAGEVDLVGHSLGGALAQHVAEAYGRVRRCVTFQSPGIGDPLPHRRPSRRVAFTHHYVAGDFVHLAGGAHRPGHFRRHDVDLQEGDHAHTAMPLAELGQLRQRALRGAPGPGTSHASLPLLVDASAYVPSSNPQLTPHGPLKPDYRGPQASIDPDEVPHARLLASSQTNDPYRPLAERARKWAGDTLRGHDLAFHGGVEDTPVQRAAANRANAAMSPDGAPLQVSPRQMVVYVSAWRWARRQYVLGHPIPQIKVAVKENWTELDELRLHRLFNQLDRLQQADQSDVR